MNRPTRWPLRVVTSSPTMTVERQLPLLREPLRHDRGVDALMVRDGDDVQMPLHGCGQYLLHARHAVRRKRVDMQVGHPRPG